MAKVFVSYAREARDAARQLVADISGLGHRAWFDEELTGGSSWWDGILENIRDCDVFVFALSTHSLDSAACRRECTYALDLKKALLPVLVGDGVELSLLPESLAKTQIVDYQKSDKAALQALARGLNGLPAARTLPDPLPDPPAAPISYLGKLREQIDSSTPLDFGTQSGIVLHLKNSLQDGMESQLIGGLLRKLRAREDLYARVAAEVDALLVMEPFIAKARARVDQGVPVVSSQPLPNRDAPAPSKQAVQQERQFKRTAPPVYQPPRPQAPPVYQPRRPHAFGDVQSAKTTVAARLDEIEKNKLTAESLEDIEFEKCVSAALKIGCQVSRGLWSGYVVRKRFGGTAKFKNLRELQDFLQVMSVQKT